MPNVFYVVIVDVSSSAVVFVASLYGPALQKRQALKTTTKITLVFIVTVAAVAIVCSAKFFCMKCLQLSLLMFYSSEHNGLFCKSVQFQQITANFAQNLSLCLSKDLQCFSSNLDQALLDFSNFGTTVP